MSVALHYSKKPGPHVLASASWRLGSHRPAHTLRKFTLLQCHFVTWADDKEIPLHRIPQVMARGCRLDLLMHLVRQHMLLADQPLGNVKTSVCKSGTRGCNRGGTNTRTVQPCATPAFRSKANELPVGYSCRSDRMRGGHTDTTLRNGRRGCAWRPPDWRLNSG